MLHNQRVTGCDMHTGPARLQAWSFAGRLCPREAALAKQLQPEGSGGSATSPLEWPWAGCWVAIAVLPSCPGRAHECRGTHCTYGCHHHHHHHHRHHYTITHHYHHHTTTTTTNLPGVAECAHKPPTSTHELPHQPRHTGEKPWIGLQRSMRQADTWLQ
jgi:hypothetical protein